MSKSPKLLSLGLLTKILYAFISISYTFYMSSRLILITLTIFGEATSYNTPHYAVFSGLLTLAIS